MAVRRIAVTVAAAIMAPAALAQLAPLAPPAAKPLFAGDAPIRFALTGPISEIARAGAQSRQPRVASLTIPAAVPEVHPIQLSARGITRLKRDVCQFPPLRVQFQRPPPPASVFHGQGRLKLVTHCRAAASFQQHLLLEYAAYRLYNQLTPASFRARLASIDYVNEGKGPVTSRLGFFIDEIADVAARNGMARAVAGDRISLSGLSRTDAARVAMFEYMIGNRDWSVRAGPPGEGCCHNSRLIARAGGGAFIPVPYDFDFSGLVNAPYAIAPDGVSSVRARNYQGFCAHNAEALAVAAEFRAKRGPLLAVLNAVPLEEPVRRRAAAYLDGFFADIADDSKVAKVVRTCIQ